MGFRIKSGNWRRPLQVIDSFLPRREEALPPAPPVLSRCLRSFQRAGWLGKQAARKGGGAPAAQAQDESPAARVVAASAVRVIHAAPEQAIVVPRRPSARVVISGRMADVCAELERLAAMEARIGRA